jgi:RNA polymerase-binding transcription factor DksA
MVTIDARKQQLEARLAELTDRLTSIEDKLEQPVSERFEEQATEREDDEVLEDLGAAGVREIRMIEAALDRIANGSYGTCASCGDPIGDARLDVLP